MLHMATISDLGCNLNLLFAVQPFKLEVGSNNAVPEGGILTLECMSMTSNPAVIISWTEGSTPILSQYITVTPHSGKFYGTQIHSQVILSAEKNRNGRIVTCTAEFDGVVLEELSRQFVLNVTCKYNAECFHW